MVISESQIRRIMPKANNDNVKLFVFNFNQWNEVFGINIPIRVVMFLGQIAHESGELNFAEENLNYSADALLRVFPKYFNEANVDAYARNPKAIANRAYANRMGNGDEKSGDGWRYRGRGLIQLTGKANYQAYANSEYCNGDLVSHPEWLAKYPGALKSAMWFWKSHGLNEIADRDDVETLTKRINGGINGMASRKYYTKQAKKVFGV